MWEVDNISPFPLLLWSLLHLIIHSSYFDVTVIFLIIDASSNVSRFHGCFSVYLLILLAVFCSHKYFLSTTSRFLYMSPCPTYLLDTKYPLMLFPLLSLFLCFSSFLGSWKETYPHDWRSPSLAFFFYDFVLYFFTLPQGFLNLAPTQLYPLPPAYRVIIYVQFNISCSHISHSIERGRTNVES